MDKPLLTIVIPVYNRCAIVGRTLDSIGAQTCRDFRLILVDNGSTDGTPDELRRRAAAMPVETVVLEEGRSGAAAARQCGLDAVGTEWTMFFDSDDTMEPRHVERALEAVRRHPDVEVVGWDVNRHCGGRSFRYVFTTCDVMFRSLFNGTMGTQRYFARTEIFRRAGGWNPSLGVWDDIELGARIIALRPKMLKLCGPVTVDMYDQPDSLTRGESLSNLPAIERALSSISATIGPKGPLWTGLKLIILAALADTDEARALRDSTAARMPKRYRLLMRAAYAYTARGGRGIARILRPLL